MIVMAVGLSIIVSLSNILNIIIQICLISPWCIQTLNKRKEEGRKEGRREGRKDGRKKGRKEGRKKEVRNE